MKTRAAGITLIELLIVVAIITILATIAVPAYQQYVTKSKRNQAEAVMLSIAQSEERYYTNNYAYYAINTTTDAPPNTEAQGWPNYAGADMGTRTYNISVATAATTYTITAAPYATNFTDTQCGTLTLDSAGNKGPSSSCW
jgi:type IV pilus assembly protein PilE